MAALCRLWLAQLEGDQKEKIHINLQIARFTAYLSFPEAMAVLPRS